jgi:exonuclease VII large subunit
MSEHRHNPTRDTSRLPEETARKGDENEHRVLQALNRHGSAIMPGVFNRKERKLVRNYMMAELQQGFEQRRQALGLILETRLHSIREACNHLLVTGKTHLRQQRIEYFGSVYRQLAHELDHLSETFLGHMDDRFQKLETFKTPCIRRREQKRLEKSVDDFLDTLDQLMEEFRNIISENVDHNDVESRL